VTTTDALVFPPDRYGWRRDPRRRRRQRWLVGALALLVAAGGVAIAVKLFSQYVNPPYQVENVMVGDVTDTSVTISFDLDQSAGPASCTVVALAHDGARLAEVELPVAAPPAGQTSTHVTYTIKTSARPFTASVPGCGPRS